MNSAHPSQRGGVRSPGLIGGTLISLLLLLYFLAEPLLEVPLTFAWRRNWMEWNRFDSATHLIDAPGRYLRGRCVPYQHWMEKVRNWLAKFDLLEDEEIIEVLPVPAASPPLPESQLTQ